MAIHELLIVNDDVRDLISRGVSVDEMRKECIRFGMTTLREAVGADDDEWARARGWALLQSVAQLAHFTDRNPWLAATARRTLAEIADEVRTGQT